MKISELDRYRNETRVAYQRPASLFLLFAAMAVTLLPRPMYAAPPPVPAPFLYPTALSVGTGSNVQSVPVLIEAAGTIATITVLTQGAPAQDFTPVSNDTCASGRAFNAGEMCAASVRFQPKAPGTRPGAILLLNANGQVLGSTLLYGVGVGPLGVFLPATIRTVAGNGAWVFRGDGGAATESSIFLPGGMAVDGAGNLFLSDSSNNRIRRVESGTGLISTVAGTGSPGSEGDGGLATSASVNTPTGMAIDGAGNIIFADSANHAVRKLTLATGVLSTVAGRLGQQGYTGDGGAPSSALLNTPESVAFDGSGNLFVSDTGNHVVRRIDAVTGILSTVAGTGLPGFSGDGGVGAAAALNTPWGIATDALGSLYIADQANQRIRKLTAGGTITTVVGTSTGTYNGDGEAATSANIADPSAVAVDVAGNLYIADSGNNLIRKVSATSGKISTIAGTGAQTFSGDKGPSTLASMYGPYALALDSSGNLFLSDIFHHRIREIFNTQASLAYPAIRVGRTSAPKPQGFENDGNDVLTFTGVTPDNNSALDVGTTTCSTSRPLASDATCVLGAEFSPQSIGNPVNSTIDLQSNAANTAAALTLSGEVDALEPTSTLLTSSRNPSAAGSLITFTAVTSGAGSAPSGNIRFFDGATLIGTSATNSSSTATLALSSLNLGTHTITAAFTGDPTNSPSTSAPLSQVVKQTPVITILSSQTPSKVGSSVTLTASVTASTLQPAGLVTFNDGATVVGNGTLDANGFATFSTSILVAGAHSLTAVYVGDANTLAGTSPVLIQTINPWATTLTLSSSPGNSIAGSPLTFDVAVTPTGTVPPAGSVTLTDGSTVLATITLDKSGHASATVSNLAVGTHGVTATFRGDSTNAASQSSLLTVVVQQVPTTTTLTGSSNPAVAGAVLRLTATVSAPSALPDSGALTGSVTFSDGTLILGTAAVSPSGLVTLDLSSLTVGQHSLTASYIGSTNYTMSRSSVLPEAIQLASTAVQLTSSSPASIAGSGVTLTAIVSGTGSVPTGSVTFFDGARSLGASTVNSSGQANLSVSTLAAGPHAITASYAGDPSDNASTSSALAQAVLQATTAIALTSSANPSIAGISLTFIASLSSNGSLPQGQITLRDGSSILATVPLSLTGASIFTVPSLAAGSHSLTANFIGDADHTASVSSLTQLVQQGTSSSAVVSSQSTSVFGESIVLTARVSGTGNQPRGFVTFIDGASSLGLVNLDSNGIALLTLSTLSIGDHSISVTYAGDLTHSAAEPAALVQRVQQSTTTALTSRTNPIIVGAALQLTARVVGASGAALTGTVSFTDGPTILGVSPVDATGTASLSVSSLAAGTHLVIASYSGDALSRTSVSPAFSQSVNSAGTSITLASSANPTIVGNVLTLTAKVSSVGEPPTGLVTFLDGSFPLGSASITSGVATLSVSTLVAGQHALTARYAGDTGTQVSTSTVLLQVARQSTSITLLSSANPVLTAQGLVLTAILHNGVNATGVVTFLDGTTTLGSVTLDASATATLSLVSLNFGTHALSVTYSGDTFNLASDSTILPEAVQLRSTTASMTASSDTYLSAQPITLVAVIHSSGPLPPTGTVTFTSGTAVVGSAPLSTSGAATLTFFPVASAYRITATYAGDPVYAGSTSDTYAIQAGPSTTFTMTANPNAVTLTSGTHTTIDLTIGSIKGFSDTLALGCLELPADSTCTFSEDRPALAKDATTVVHLTFDTGNPLGSGAQARADRRSPKSFEAGLLLPAALLLGVLLALARRRQVLPALLPLALLVLTGIAVTGCGTSLTTSTTPAGSYTIRIMASGTASGASQIVDLPLKVN